KLRFYMEKADQKAPEYIKMAESLNAGETTYSLERASNLRIEVQRMYELIDALSKKILTLGLNEDPQPHPRTLQLQRMIRYSATLFVQEKLLGLMSLPTKDQYEELKEKKKQDLERKLQMERLVKYEPQRRQEEKPANYASRSLAVSNGEVHRTKRVAVKKAEGWLPTASISRNQELTDPLLQQIDNITSFIKQAKEANRLDEVQMLQENLRQLQDEYDQQQTVKAIELSKKQAEMEEMQREQLQILCEKEWKRDHKKKMSQHSRTRSLDFREVKHDKLEIERGSINQIAQALDLDKLQDKDYAGSKAAFPSDGIGLPDSKNLVLVCQPVKASECEKPSINPFEDPLLISPPKSDPESPVAEKSAVVPLPINTLQSYKREYNPFEEEEEEQDCQQANGVELSAPNPFEDSVGNPFYTPVDSLPAITQLIVAATIFERSAAIGSFRFSDPFPSSQTWGGSRVFSYRSSAVLPDDCWSGEVLPDDVSDARLFPMTATTGDRRRQQWRQSNSSQVTRPSSGVAEQQQRGSRTAAARGQGPRRMAERQNSGVSDCPELHYTMDVIQAVFPRQLPFVN
ncbi:rabenosyn-5, partial [Crotalus adamanteus]